MRNENLRKARLEKKLTQDQMAKILGYKGKQTVANWENGYAYPTLHKAIQTAELLGKSVSYLFGYKYYHLKGRSYEKPLKSENWGS